MGVNLSGIVPKKELKFEELLGRIVAVDAFNVLYQFLTTIRQVDGTPLQDSQGRVTSHLSGLFYRFTNLLSRGIKPIFVFDGKPPELKSVETARRNERKNKALKEYEKAKKAKKLEDMGKYARQLSRLTDDMIDESKRLADSLGFPVVQAPSEGEAQASFICKQNDAYATASQDFDSLLFGSPRLVQNLTLATRRKVASGYVSVNPELISLEEVKKKLKVSQEQLIVLGILIGTDYNPRGYVGIGPKKALDLVKVYKSVKRIFSEAEKISKEKINFDPLEVLELFKKIPVTKKYRVRFKKINENKVRKILCEEHEFSDTRVENALKRLEKARDSATQVTLGEF